MTGRDLMGLVTDLQTLGIQKGQDLLVHSSMRRVNPAGGAIAVLEALRISTGPDATIVVPAQTPANSFSSSAFRAATEGLGGEELARFVAAMLAFDPATTPSSGMGVFAECLRTEPGAARSGHPQASFAALGPHAARCMARHELTCHLGEQSPLGWLYRASAAILLLGVGYEACTAFHLAEYRLPRMPSRRSYQCFVSEGGKRTKLTFFDINLDDSDFAAVGREIDKQSFVRRGVVGSADCRVLPLRAAVDFAVARPSFGRLRSPS